MLEFPKEYYEDEVRDGFYVSSIMKKCWAAQLVILNDIDTVCRRHNIKWYADCGTLLGAVRHGGFIPWDDDLDICMFRDDYYRFLSVAKKELCDIWHGYDILNYHNEEYWEMISRVVNATSMGFGADRMEKFNGYPFSVGVDVFPLDYVCSDPEEEEARTELLKVIFEIAKNEYVEAIDDEQLQLISELTGRTLDRSKSIKLQLYELAELISSMFRSEEADSVALMPFWYQYGNHRYPKELFDHTVMLPFENTYIQAPIGYHQILRIEYGDYMRLVKTAGLHGYPYFEPQLEELEKRMGADSPLHRRISRNDIGLISDSDSRGLGDRLSASTDKHKKEVVFLPFKPSTWSTLEHMWRQMKEKEDTDVFVIPIPYYEKLPSGDLGERLYVDADYPDYVEITDHREYDISSRRPDAIVVQYPYDDDNYATTIDPIYYSRELRKYTDNLVYVPYFITDEIEAGEERSYKMMDYYAISPAVLFADRVIVRSEHTKKLYVQKLSGFFGEDTGDIWEDKIEAASYPVSQIYRTENALDEAAPDEWKHILFREDGSMKKVVIYYISACGLFEYRERMIKKISRNLELFSDNCKDIALLFMADPLIDRVIPVVDGKLYNDYNVMVEEFRDEAFGVLVDTGDNETALSLAAAFYGDAGRLANECHNRRLPVMIQSAEVAD